MQTTTDELESSVKNKNPTVQEEVWLNAEGINVFDEVLTPKLVVRTLQLQEHDITVRYKSYAEIGMTPLDMYNSLTASVHQDHDLTQPEYYDGTGTMVWLASQALAWAFDQDVHGIFSNFVSKEKNNPTEKTVICELGCGTGVAGLSALLLTAQNASTRGNDVRVIFTDNDKESLDNCRDNCELNGIPSDRYNHECLSWGMSETYPSNCVGDVDLVLAADVLYDLKMIVPLLQTAFDLLRPNVAIQSDGSPSFTEGGHMILSHVPRFCLSRHDHELDDDHNSSNNKPSDPDHTNTRKQLPSHLLEQHIIDLALSCGFVLITMFRPHMALQASHAEDQRFPHHRNRDSSISCRKSETISVHDDVLNQGQLANLESAHACIFVFRKGHKLDVV